MAVANLAALEFGPLRDQAIAVDEVFFAACAARDNSTGEFPSFGCHDNKTPLIYVLHQLVQQIAAGGDVVLAVKTAAFVVVALIAAVAAALAWRLGGTLAAIIAAALLLLTMSGDAYLLALKTEPVGTIFVLLGLLALARPNPEPFRWLVLGLAFGIAVQVKQTFAFPALAVLIVGLCMPGSLRHRLLRMVLASVGMLLPALVLMAAFAVQGTLPEHLASAFLYPTIYQPELQGSWVGRLAWRTGGVIQDMSLAPAVVLLALLSLPSSWLGRASGADTDLRWPLRALVVAMLALLLVAFVSPIYFAYHLLPFWVLACVAAGLAVARLAPLMATGSPAWHLAAVLALSWVGASMAVGSWYDSGGKSAEVRQASTEPPLVEGRAGDHGYVLGIWPQFYVYGQLTPASDVFFPWALPGTPKNWAFTPPEPGSWKGRWLAAVQERAVEKLMRDFSRTPPDYIVVTHDLARRPDSTRVTDVLEVDAYIAGRCVYAGPAPRNLGSEQSLFRCSR